MTTGTCDGKLGFRIHAVSFAATIALLFGINLITGGPLWAGWVLAGWGMSLAAHWWFGPRARAA